MKKKYNAASAAKKAKMERLKPQWDAYVEKQIQLAYLNVSESCAEESVRLRNGHDIADAKRVACDVKENSSEVAGKMTHSWDMEYLAIFNERGEMPTAEEHKESVQVSTSRMKQQDIIQYETDANVAKEAFYKGESKYPFLTEEYYTATTVGIGMGATLNENMTEEQKAEFLNTWDTHAQKYKDYNSVKEQYDTAIKEYIEKHPESKQGIENIKTKYQQKYGKTPDEPKVRQKMTEQKSANKVEVTQSVAETSSSTLSQTLTSNPTTVKPKADETTLKSELKSKTIAEVKRDYSNSMSEIAEVILKNDVEYRNRIDEVLDYFNGLSGIDIGFKIKGCTTHTISKIIQAYPGKANDILSIVAPTMCYAGKQLVERMVEEEKGQQSEAA